MYTDADKKELSRLVDIVCNNMKEALENHDVLPASITHNAGKVGVTIQIRKIYNPDIDHSGEDH